MVFVPPSPGPFYARPPSPIPLSRTPSQRSEISGRKPHQIWAPVVPSPPGSYYVPLPPPDMFYVPPPSPGPYYVPPLPPGPFYSPLPSPGSYILPPLPPGPFYSPPSPNPYTLPPPLPPGPFYSPPLPPPPIPYYIPHTPSYETLSQRPETNIPVPHRVIWAPGGDILKLAYHPDGRRVVCCFDDGTIRVWNLENGEQEGASMEHTSTYVGTLALTGDGTRIISCDEDGSIRMWDIESRELVREWTYQGGNPELAISPDDQLIAVGSWMVFFYTTEGRQLDHSITVGKVVRSLSFSPSGDKLACGTRSDIYVYDVANGTLLLGPLQGHKDNVDRLLWSHDGGRLFSASRDRTVRCWNPDTGEQIGEPWIHNYSVLSLSLSPDGSKLASASYGGVRFWDTISASPMTHHLPHVYGVNAVSFSPSGEFVASAELHGKISLWRAPWLDPIESPASNGDVPNLRSILPNLSLGLDERQRIFEVRLRKLLNLATSKGFQVSRDVFPPSLPVSSANTPLTGTERIADGDSNAIDTSPIEPSTSVPGSNSNGVTKETRKVDKIKRNIFDMLRDVVFKRSRGKDT